MIENAREVLRSYWGYADFRPGQVGIIEASLHNRDVLAILPTGGGKSICFQVPGILLPGLTLVISPLIALMDDQVRHLTQKGIKAYRIHSGLSSREVNNILENCINGPVKFLYISPERLESSRFRASLPFLPITQLAVDEAHCISQWGHDFRPAYQRIGTIRDIFPKVPVRGFTATATRKVREDIISSLGLKDPFIWTDSIYRPNLSLKLNYTEDRIGDIIQHCVRFRNECGIIYVRNRKACVDLSNALRQRSVNAAPYHAGMEVEARSKAMEQWLTGEVSVMVATNAFGMGIDKADVRYVLHVEAPPDLESYYQEAGRAGRDGLPSEAILFHQAGDEKRIFERWQEQFVDIEIVRQVYKRMALEYQVAVGDQPEDELPLDLRQLSSLLNLPEKVIYYALRLLQLGGWIEWNAQASNTASTFQLTVSPGMLPDSDHVFPFMDNMLRWMLRLYEGVLSMPVIIDEGAIANFVAEPKARVIQALQFLHTSNYAEYKPGTGLPVFRYVSPRIKSSQLRFEGSKIDLIYKWEQQKLKGVIEYLKGARCLYSSLAAYFDLPGIDHCGHCSVCYEESKKSISSDIQSELRALIRHSPTDMKDIIAHLGEKYAEDSLFQAIERLLDEELIILVKGKYRCP